MDIKTEKKNLRRQILTRLQPMQAGERRQRSAVICQALASAKDYKQSENVLLFAPLKTEPDLSFLWLEAGEGKRFFFPRVAEGKSGLKLEFIAFENFTGDFANLFTKSEKFGVWEPKVEHNSRSSTRFFHAQYFESALILLPGLAFASVGKKKVCENSRQRAGMIMRLGRGGGFYDRFLRSLREWESCNFCKVGVAFAMQYMENLPFDDGDEFLDKFVCEDFFM